MRRLLYIFLAISLCACQGRQTSGPEAQGDTLALKYAQLLTVVEGEDYTIATLKNPWKEGYTLHRYILVPNGKELPAHLPKGTIIRTPLQRAVIFTTVHSALLMSLGAQERIAGVADLKYIKIPWIHEQVTQGKIVDCGDGMNPLIEKIIDLHPDAILLSPFENSGGYGKLEEIDIPLVECAEYMEVSPLARAEWMRFYGLLFGCQEKADSLFAVVDSSYHALRREAEGYGKGRSVVIDKQVGSVWYVPGGSSTIGQMLKDAGGLYPWVEDTHSGSLSLPFETVLEKAGNTETWLFRYDTTQPMTLSRLLAEKEGYRQFHAFQTGEVYGCNVNSSLFYEESPFRPDWLLNDFISIIHPERQASASLRYYHRLTP